MRAASAPTSGIRGGWRRRLVGPGEPPAVRVGGGRAGGGGHVALGRGCGGGGDRGGRGGGRGGGVAGRVGDHEEEQQRGQRQDQREVGQAAQRQAPGGGQLVGGDAPGGVHVAGVGGVVVAGVGAGIAQRRAPARRRVRLVAAAAGAHDDAVAVAGDEAGGPD